MRPFVVLWGLTDSRPWALGGPGGGFLRGGRIKRGRKNPFLGRKSARERTHCADGAGGGILLAGGRKAAERSETVAKKRGGSLADLQRATDLLSGLLAQEARALDKRRREEGCGDMKAMKEITAVLKDLAAVAKSLGEQQGEGGAGECGVVLLPPAGTPETEGKEVNE